MVHNCVDWTTSPPTRKLPLLILTLGDDHIYTAIPKDFKTLVEVARREFNLGDVGIKFTSSCVNLCNDLPARITESVWEHISPYLGCASVEICAAVAPIPTGGQLNRDAGVAHETQQTRVGQLPPDREPVPRANPNLFSDEQEDDNTHAENRLSGYPNAAANEPINQDPPPDHEYDHEADHEAPPSEAPEEPWEEEVSTVPPPKSRSRRRVVSDDEEAGEDSEREDAAPAKSSYPPVVSSPKAMVKKEKDENSQRRSQADLESREAPSRSSKPIKQEKQDRGSRSYNDDRSSQASRTASQSQHEPQAAATVESNESQKLMIRVAHRASKQESKFTTKSSTKVSKVIAGACKSFGLDASRATLYLIVSVDGEDDIEENLFPCDKNDSIARAGAEQDTETKFLLKIAGDL